MLWLAAATPLTNAGLTEVGNLEFLLSAVGGREKTTVLWDEYIHGYERSGATGKSSHLIAWIGLQFGVFALCNPPRLFPPKRAGLGAGARGAAALPGVRTHSGFALRTCECWRRGGGDLLPTFPLFAHAALGRSRQQQYGRTGSRNPRATRSARPRSAGQRLFQYPIGVRIVPVRHTRAGFQSFEPGASPFRLRNENKVDAEHNTGRRKNGSSRKAGSARATGDGEGRGWAGRIEDPVPAHIPLSRPRVIGRCPRHRKDPGRQSAVTNSES